MIQVQTCRRLAGAVGSWDAILRSHALRNGERIGVEQLTLLVFFPLTSPLAAPLDLITFFNSVAGKRGGFMARNKSGPHLNLLVILELCYLFFFCYHVCPSNDSSGVSNQTVGNENGKRVVGESSFNLKWVSCGWLFLGFSYLLILLIINY